MNFIHIAKDLRRERWLADDLPFTAHVDAHVVRTRQGDYVQTLRLAGASFETAAHADLNGRHRRLNVLWRSIASPHVAIWAHVIRRPATLPPRSPPAQLFAAQLYSTHRDRLQSLRLLQNELYLSLVYRPTTGRATGATARLLTRGDPQQRALERIDSLEQCARLRQAVLAHLGNYDPEPLGVVERAGVRYSSLLEFFALLLDTAPRTVPLPRAPLAQVVGAARPIIGRETVEYRLPTATRVGAFLGIQDYATPTWPGMLDPLLSAPFSFICTNSFAFLSRPVAQGLLVRQGNQLANSGDFALSQAEQIPTALDELSSGEWVMGDHHFSLQVLTDLASQSEGQSTATRLKDLNEHVALALSLLVDTQCGYAREDLGLPAAYWSQLPGVFAWRPRKAPITSRNFAALMPMHNYPGGRAQGNHWGESLAVLATPARTAFHFSLHASDPRANDGGARKDTGHTLILGPTGSGKTVWIGFCVAMLMRFGTTQVVIDKDRGLQILIQALGGAYTPLRNRQPTALNPLSLTPTPANVDFLRQWLFTLARRPGRELTLRNEAELDQALRGTLALEAPQRRLSRVWEFLDCTNAESVGVGLARWCEAAGGEDAWVFDHPEDVFAPTLARHALIGVDVTDFLDNERVRTPITMYLLHLVRGLLDGRRVACTADEFSRLLDDGSFEHFAQDGLQTWRKQDAAFIAAAQSPSTVLASRIARVVFEQCATKMYLPNPDAVEQDYVDGCGLTQREFRRVREDLTPGQCLIKQGHHSVVCELDLRGCDEELAVLSGRTRTVAMMQQLIDVHGPEPGAWLPSFLQQFRRESPHA